MKIPDKIAEKALDYLIAQDKVWGVMVRDMKAAMEFAFQGEDYSRVSTTHALCELLAERDARLEALAAQIKEIVEHWEVAARVIAAEAIARLPANPSADALSDVITATVDRLAGDLRRRMQVTS